MDEIPTSHRRRTVSTRLRHDGDHLPQNEETNPDRIIHNTANVNHHTVANTSGNDEDDDRGGNSSSHDPTGNDNAPSLTRIPSAGGLALMRSKMPKLHRASSYSSPFSDQYRDQSKRLKVSIQRYNLHIKQTYAADHGLATTTSSTREFTPEQERQARWHYATHHPLERARHIWLQMRWLSGRIVNQPSVQLFVVGLIALNAIMLGIATFDVVRENYHVANAFETADRFILIIFTVELGMQFAFYGYRLVTDGWLVFDLIIITLSWAFEKVQIIRAFRIVRAFRLITRIRVLKNLVAAVFSVIPRMLAIGLLLLLLSYIFGVMFTQLFKDFYKKGYTEEDFYGRLDLTLFTLFQIMTLDDWADLCRDVMQVQGYEWSWILFITFIIATAFVVLNLIIAVICDAVAEFNKIDRARLRGRAEEKNNAKLIAATVEASKSPAGDGTTSSVAGAVSPDGSGSQGEDISRGRHPHAQSHNEQEQQQQRFGQGLAGVFSFDDVEDDDSLESWEGGQSVSQFDETAEMRKRLVALETHMHTLEKIQTDSIMALELLARQLQIIDPEIEDDPSAPAAAPSAAAADTEIAATTTSSTTTTTVAKSTTMLRQQVLI